MMRAYIGASESGKTYTMGAHVRQAALAGWRVVVVDLVQEWPRAGLFRGLEWSRTSDLRRAMGTVVAGRPVTIYQPHTTDDETVAVHVDHIAEAAIRAPFGVLLAVPEAHVAFREHRRLGEHVGEVVTRFRHRNVNVRLWIDTQMLADVSKRVWDVCREVYLFGGAARRDGGRVRELGGRELEAKINEAGALAARGRPGYHVRVTPLDCRPPFRLERV